MIESVLNHDMTIDCLTKWLESEIGRTLTKKEIANLKRWLARERRRREDVVSELLQAM